MSLFCSGIMFSLLLSINVEQWKLQGWALGVTVSPMGGWASLCLCDFLLSLFHQGVAPIPMAEPTLADLCVCSSQAPWESTFMVPVSLSPCLVVPEVSVLFYLFWRQGITV